MSTWGLLGVLLVNTVLLVIAVLEVHAMLGRKRSVTVYSRSGTERVEVTGYSARQTIRLVHMGQQYLDRTDLPSRAKTGGL